MVLRTCRAEVESDAGIHPLAQARLNALLEFVDTMDRWYGQMKVIPRPQIAAMVRLGAKIVSLLSFGRRKK